MARRPPSSTQDRTLFPYTTLFRSPAGGAAMPSWVGRAAWQARRSEEHTSELQSHGLISYAVFCLKKKTRRVKSWSGASSAAPGRRCRTGWLFSDTATTEIYTRPYTLSLHDALPISRSGSSSTCARCAAACWTRPTACSRSEEHTSELQSHGLISYAVFCLKKKK